MNIKNRKGSTLALTIMIFAVLMIFATFTLGFMVTENKQAMYHQNKTQAYYIARSGAEAVEETVLQVYKDAYTAEDNTEVKQFFDLLYNQLGVIYSIDPVVIDGNESFIKLQLDDMKSDGINYQLSIISTAYVNNVSTNVTKILNITKPTIMNKIEIDGPVKYVNSINDNIDKINEFRPGFATKGENYPIPQFNTFSEESGDDLRNDPIITGSLSGNYYVQNLYGSQLVGKTLSGVVNIYVKGRYTISPDENINLGGEPGDLNIYVYGEGVTSQPTVDIYTGNGQTITQIANLRVKSGTVLIDAHKYQHIGNIELGEGTTINFKVNSNPSESHVNVTGIIYAPGSTINIALPEDNHGSFNVKGSIVGYDVNYNYKVNNANQVKFDVDNTGGENNNPIELPEDVFITLQKGYYK